MKKIIMFVLLAAIMHQAIAQTATFDIATYTPPKEWTKVIGNGVISYTNMNKDKGIFCVLSMYASSASSGDANTDFKTEWTDRVVTPHQAEANPKTETQSQEGWIAVSGGAQIKLEGADAYSILTVFSGFGKKFSVLTTLNDQSYVNGIDAILKDIKLDKTVKNSEPVSTDKSLSIIGTWSDYSGSLGNYVNSSGVFIHSADTHEMHQYIFNGDKTFAYKELISSNNISLYTESSGTYSIAGDNLTLTIKMYKSGFGTIKEDKTKETTEQYKFYIGANKWEAGPFLNMHKDGNYYPWSDFPYDYYKKIINGSKSETKDSFDKNKTAINETAGLQANQSSGAIGKFGSLTYNIPKGWKVAKYPDGDIITPLDIPKGEFLEIWVQPAMNFSGTIEQALQKSYDETIVNLKATKMNEVNGGSYTAVTAKTSFRGWEYIRCSGGIHLGGGEYPPEYGLDLFLIKINSRFEQVAIIKSRNNCSTYSRYYPSDKLKYYNDIENFLFSVQFTEWKEPIVQAATVKGDGIVGVWQGISMSVGMAKPGAELGAELKVKQLIFFSNGQAYFGKDFPAEGLDELNTWAKAEFNRRDWGTYSFSNGRGVLKLSYAEVPLRMENNKLVITTNKTDHGFIETNTVDGAKFNGTYALSSKNFAGEETGKTPLISFTADGKFTDNGAVKILYHQYVDCLNAGQEPGAGTYEVKNYSVILNYTDGRKIKIAFIGTDYDKSNLSPATLTLSFNEDVLKKK